ncbi:MAG: methenyltetrahydromethanopterin cyclohydrolase [Pseudomonadota bacterium]|jgi:methenyltetrahydromethanopterin cyclohydrolase
MSVAAPFQKDENLQLQSSRWPSVSAWTAPQVGMLLRDADALRLGVTREKATIIDAGINVTGGLEAGRRIAEICMGGQGIVSLQHTSDAKWPIQVVVHSANPVLACLASQYAGWSLSYGEGKGAYHAMASGPGRAVSVKESLFAELGYKDISDSVCLVLETGKFPPQEIINKIMRDCGVAEERISLILTPTGSLAGVVQIVARVLEVALHKVHTLGFPLSQIVDGMGGAPLPTPSKDFLTSMGRTNDAILFGGHVQLFVNCSDDAAADLAKKLPCNASRDYGRPFARIFKETNYDFYKIDPMLFAPAKVVVSNVATGNSFTGGEINHQLLDLSFGGPGG